MKQYVGRLNRIFEDKRLLKIYDYVDINYAQFENMYYKRLKYYKKEDFLLRDPGCPEGEENVLYDGSEFKELWIQDLGDARSSVLIFSPRIYPSNATTLTPLLLELDKRKVSVTVFTQTAADASNESVTEKKHREGLGSLRSSLSASENCEVIEVPVMRNQHVIIDHSLIWFGSCEPLGYIGKQGNMMRFHSRVIAERLSVPSCSEKLNKHEYTGK